MGRVIRADVGGVVYHVLNRANFRSTLFRTQKEYKIFLDIIRESIELSPMRVLAYCLMPNHWHLVLYPEHDGDLSKFMHRVTLTHTQRFHAKTRTIGYGHIYQGRYKSFPVQDNQYFLSLVRYVERNAKRASLVGRAEQWRWSSAHLRTFGSVEEKKLLSPWPVEEPSDYLVWLNTSQPKEEIENIRLAAQRSRPLGSEDWVEKTTRNLGLENSMRRRGRPKKGT
jgi:putative transposase